MTSIESIQKYYKNNFYAHIDLRYMIKIINNKPVLIDNIKLTERILEEDEFCSLGKDYSLDIVFK